jgi:hypothetical protein
MLNPNLFEQEFFKLYPQFKLLFPEIEKKKNGGNIMWGLALFLHPDSIYWSKEKNERKDIICEAMKIEKDYLDDRDLLKRFQAHILTFYEKSLASWKFKVEEIDELISSTPTDWENVEEMYKALNIKEKLLKSYTKAESDFLKEKESQVHGGASESPNEAGKI